MSDNSRIEWTEATWNPVAGCDLVSPGCTNCYAMKVAARLATMPQPNYVGLTKPSKAGPVWTGKIALVESALTKPLSWRRRRRIFVNSMSDLFHEAVPDDYIDKVFAVMALCRQHTFQVLTKRADRMRDYSRRRAQDWMHHIPQAGLDVCHAAAQRASRPSEITLGWPLPNVWLGMSVEDQRRADERIPLLLDTPAALRWISAEPLLGPVDLAAIRFDMGAGLFGDALNWHHRPYADERRYSGIDWVVVGGESGPDARPMHPDWARSLRDQCEAAGVPFFFKQWGEFVADDQLPDGYVASENPYCVNGANFERLGKHAAGRTLDGRTHDEYPPLPDGLRRTSPQVPR
jgi:protein gp37